MIRPNMAMDAPPTSIEVGGLLYDVNTDYRVWIQAAADMRDFLSRPESDEDVTHNAVAVTKLCIRVLGKPIAWESAEQITDFIGAVTSFLQGYPQPPIIEDGKQRPQVMSLEYDINAIVIAIKHYYGIDIGWSCEHLHWWVFLEYLRNLCGDDLMISRLMEIRGYTGKDDELRKRASMFALPKLETADDRRMMDEINDEFYGAH